MFQSFTVYVRNEQCNEPHAIWHGKVQSGVRVNVRCRMLSDQNALRPEYFHNASNEITLLQVLIM